jgi:hypothetical protein
MSIIERINTHIPKPISKTGEIYRTVIGQDPFTPELTVIESADFNCGALANELEFLNLFGEYFVDSTVIDSASGGELESLIFSLVDLSRRGSIESDTVFRNRFKGLLTEKTNPSRVTKWAIRDALSHFLDVNNIEVLELFDSYNCYFEVRFNGGYGFEDVMFVDSPSTGYLDSSYIGGISIGSPVTYVGEILERIKAAGVEFLIRLVLRGSVLKTSNARIGSVQKYFTIGADVKVQGIQLTTTINAKVV